jgi:hypothetical protein
MRIAPENEYYHEVSLYDAVRLTRLAGAGLSQAATVDNPVANHEIVVIVGSPSKLAKATLIKVATKLTEHTRVNQGGGGIHVFVEAMAFRELPPLGEPRHVEGDLTAWIVNRGMVKRSGDESDNCDASAGWQRHQLTDKLEAEGERFQLGTRVFWLVLGTACAALGSALFMILTK